METHNIKKQNGNEQTHNNKSRQRKNTRDTQEEYKHRINNFMHNNQFTTINNNPNQYYQKIIKQTLKRCNNTKGKHMEVHEYETHSSKPTCNNKATQTRHTHWINN
jgi:hypothetical protein